MANITLAALLFLVLFGAVNTSHGHPELRGAYTHHGMDIINVSDGAPADQAGLEPGMTIVSVNENSTMNLATFRSATQTLKPNQTVTVETDENGTFSVTLTRRQIEGDLAYEPAPVDRIFPSLEKQAPGTIQTYETYLAPLMQEDTETHIARWTWIAERFPELEERAEERIQELEAADDEPLKGVMGATVAPDLRVKEGFEPYIGPLFNIFQLVFFIALLNFLIGLANLLPVKGLDGGWMFHVATTEYIGERGEVWTRWITITTLLLIGISFAFLIGGYLI